MWVSIFSLPIARGDRKVQTNDSSGCDLSCTLVELLAFLLSSWAYMRTQGIERSANFAGRPSEQKNTQSGSFLIIKIQSLGSYCHLSDKIGYFSDNLPRCQAPSADWLAHIIWRSIVGSSFPAFHYSSSPDSAPRAPKYMEKVPRNA